MVNGNIPVGSEEIDLPDFVLQWVYDLGDFNTTGVLDAVPDEQGARAQGNPPWQLQLDASASPQQLTVSDDDANFNEIGDPGQVLANPITIDGTTYPAGSRVVINYVLTTDDGFEGYSITLGANNTGSNTTTAFVTNSKMVPGQTYEFTSEANIGNSNLFGFDEFACFAAGTQIKTPDGDKPVEQIEPGDLVVTRDQGAMPVAWVGKRTVSGMHKMAPVVIQAGTLGVESDLVVSPNHRMLVGGVASQLFLGLDEVLVAAKALINGKTIVRRKVDMVTYVHLMFETHQVICSNGAWSESYYAGHQALSQLKAQQLEELCALFPELDLRTSAQPARPLTKSHETKVISEFLSL